MSGPGEPVTAEGAPWRYDSTAPRGRKLLLLTIGGVLVQGTWKGDLGEFFLAWQPLPKRDKVAESLLFRKSGR